jgi:hypothetical protein
MGPDIRVRHYASCVVGDVRYNTLARDKGRKTQNSAVMSTDEHDDVQTEVYGNITDIVQLQYISSFEIHRCVVLFCCRWYDQYAKTKKPRVDEYFRSINIKALYHTDEPYILANQATQIFFLEDRLSGYQDWRVVQKFDQRNSFNEVAQQDDDYIAADVEGSEDAPDMFEDRHINLVGEIFSCRPVDVDELINKTPMFKDIESEEEDGTGGNYDSY